VKVAVLRRWLRASVWALVVTGCFTDVPADGPMMIGQTEGGGCVEGSSGCPCYGNDTCDAGLTCAEGPNVCVPTGCEPGTAACVCDDGFVCDTGLDCEGSVCVVPGESTSVSSDPTMSTSMPITSTTSDDDDSTTADVTTEPDSTDTSVSASMSMSEVSTVTETGEPEDCAALDCAECVPCVEDEGQQCHSLWQQCYDTADCIQAAACMRECSLGGSCLDNCCEGLLGSTADLATMLHECRRDECYGPGACSDWEIPQCA
jgi:hypothetical protein